MPAAPRHLPLVSAPEAPTASGTATGLVGRVDDGEACDSDLLQVGDLAKATQKTVRAIHLYEELGLLVPHARSKGRYRLFGADALVRVRWIGKLQELGLSLPDIQAIVREWEAQPSAPSAMRLMRDTYVAKLDETRRQIERLRALEAELDESLRYLDTCDSCDPIRVLASCGSCHLHDCQHQTPELVAGFRSKSRGPAVGSPQSSASNAVSSPVLPPVAPGAAATERNQANHGHPDARLHGLPRDHAGRPARARGDDPLLHDRVRQRREP